MYSCGKLTFFHSSSKLSSSLADVVVAILTSGLAGNTSIRCFELHLEYEIGLIIGLWDLSTTVMPCGSCNIAVISQNVIHIIIVAKIGKIANLWWRTLTTFKVNILRGQGRIYKCK